MSARSSGASDEQHEVLHFSFSRMRSPSSAGSMAWLTAASGAGTRAAPRTRARRRRLTSPGDRALVEGAEPVEQRTLVEDVPGLHEMSGGSTARLRTCGVPAGARRAGPAASRPGRPTPGRPSAAATSRLQPRGLGRKSSWVRDERAGGVPPADVALERGPGTRGTDVPEPPSAARGWASRTRAAVASSTCGRRRAPAVGGSVCWRGRRGGPRAARRAVVRGDDDADVRGDRRRHGGESMLRPVRVLAVGTCTRPTTSAATSSSGAPRWTTSSAPGTRRACAPPT